MTEKNNYNSYTGSTPNLYRRIRQHNGELKGGAKYTTRRLNNLLFKWKYRFIIMTFLQKNDALSLEWNIKHQINRGRSKLNVDILLERFDRTIEYMIKKRNIQFDKKQMFIFLQTNEHSTYVPLYYKIIYIECLTSVVYDNRMFDYFNLL